LTKCPSDRIIRLAEGGCVGEVDCISVLGLDLWFNSKDHLPYHFHAKKAGWWEIRVSFLECTEGHLKWELKWRKKGNGPNGNERKSILEAVLAHRTELLAEWDSKVKSEEN
jgi:hypothetical protein